MSQIKVNIGGSAHDPHHRYWRSRLQVSQRKGCTVIENLASLAREVKSPPDYILQFFKNSLGVPTSLSKSPPYSGSLKGVHQASVLEKLLEGYIKLLVLCRKCDKPELSLGLSKDRRLQLSCSSCGHVATLKEGDHKVVKFVIADLQSNKPKRNNARYYSNAHGVPAKPFSLVPCEIDDSQIPSGCSGDDEGNEDGKDDPDDDDDDDWSSDTPSQDSEVKDEPSEQKVSSPPMSQPPLADPPTSLLIALQHMNLLQAPQELIKSIATACEPIEGETVKASELVRRVKQEFSSRAPELITWIRRRSGSPIAQAERLLLSALQFVLAEEFPRLGPALPHILLVLYEKEVLAEETILGWYHTNDDAASPSSRKLRQSCGEFVRWLETAEEEEEDDE